MDTFHLSSVSTIREQHVNMTVGQAVKCECNGYHRVIVGESNTWTMKCECRPGGSMGIQCEPLHVRQGIDSLTLFTAPKKIELISRPSSCR